MKKLFDNKQNSRFILEELEPRQLFSAGIEGLLINELETPLATTINIDESGEQISTQQNQVTKTSAAEKQSHEIIFVDTGVDNYQELVDDLLSNTDSNRIFEVVLLNNNQNGIEQISDTLLNHDELDAIHIISHGEDGSIQLGNNSLNANTLAENQLAITLWADSFTESGDILIYGCELTETELGKSLVNSISQLTQTDVAASDDLTGNSTLGGDWELEYKSGTIETDLAVSTSSQKDWSGVFATIPPIAHWTFDTDATDSSGNNYHGTLTNDAAIDTASATNLVDEGKLSLDGADDRVNLSDHVGSLNTLTEGSISMWFNTTDGGFNPMFFIGDSTSDNDYVQLEMQSGHLLFDVVSGGGIPKYTMGFNTQQLNDGNWHHVSITVDGGGNKFYIDGAQILPWYSPGSASNTEFFDDVNNVDIISIGAFTTASSSTGRFTGLLDDVQIHDYALTSEQVALLATVNDAPDGGEFGRYLSRLTPLVENGIWGGARFDVDILGGSIAMQGITYDYGLSTHADGGAGVIDYAIDGATRFITTVGLDNDANNNGDVVFRVLVDGVESFNSGTVTKTDNPIAISIDVTGGSVLRLEITNADADNGNDHAVWANARFEGGNAALATINENSANGTVVAYVTGNDADSPDLFTYSLTDDAGGRFALDSAGKVTVANGSLIDFETNAFHTIDVTITDTDGATSQTTLTVTVIGLNEAPSFHTPSFIAHTITTGAEGAQSVVTIDMDGDGDMDVLSASYTDDKIAWYENDGSQNFTEHVISTVADGAESVTTADVDGDGDMDVLSASFTDDKIAWYENDGSENFTERVITTGVNAAQSVTTADVDGDGDMDVLSASQYDSTIAWYENDGSENFTERVISTGARGAYSVTTADVDGDGDMDVLSALNYDDKIAWYENDGSENFTERVISTSAASAISVTTADVDGDGDMDVLSASFSDDKIAWYENDGSQNFTEHVISTVADGAKSVTTTDMDGDGDMDVLSASYFDDKVSWYENDGSQNFTEHVITTGANSAESVTTADVDGDGDMDVLSASSVDRKIAWYENVATALDGTPTFVEDGTAVVLDTDVDLSDPELDALNGGLGDYDGASLTLVRNGGVSTEDGFSFNDANGITLVGANLIKNSQIIASFNLTTTLGQLLISFTNANGETPTSTDVDNILRQITYANSSDAPPASAQIDWTFNDGNTGAQGTGGALTASGSTTVSITAVNDAPVNTVPTSITVTENVATALTGISIADAEAGSSDMYVILSVPSGALAAVTGAGVTVGGSTSALTLTGSMSDINAFIAASNITYTTAANANGSVILTVVTSDQGNTGSGGALTDSDTVTLNITAVNDSPVVATNTGASVAEGTSVTITNAHLNEGDVDDSGTGLTYSVTAGLSSGQLELTTNAGAAVTAFTQDDIDNNRLIYVHNGSQTSSDSFDFSLADGGEDAAVAATGTFNFTVSNVNDVPVNTVPGAQSVNEDTVLAIAGISVNDVDGNLSTVQLTVSSGVLNVTLSGAASVSAGTNGTADLTLSGTQTDINATLASLTYQGTLNFNGSDTLTVLSTDGDAATDSDTVAITVNAVNDAPKFGTPSFTPHTITTGANNAQSVVTADVDGDGDMDVLSASFDDDKIAWYENDGSENFTEHVISTGADGAFSVTTADVDGDGDMDVLSASDRDNKIAWYENDGGEIFTEHVITTVANDARSVTTADVDGDGDLDVLSASRGDNKIAWYENDGSENFSPHTITGSALGAISVTTADVDDDGDMDVLSASYVHDKIAWYENDGSEDFTEHVITTDADDTSSVTTADVDGDGDIDVLSASGLDDKVAWYENEGSGNFTEHVISTGADSARAVTTADVDGDGDMDVLSASAYDDKITWYENDGSENFTEHVITTEADFALSVTTADVDGDGDIDVLSASQFDDKIAWYENSPINALDATPTFIEDGTAVILDADVDLSDPELDALNGGLGDYDGASLTLVRNGGASTEDILGFNDGNGITLVGTNLIKNSQTIATFDITTTPGQLVITFTNTNGETPTSTDVDNILRQITYANSSDTPPASAQIDWTFNDGNTGAQGTGSALTVSGSTTVSMTAVNDAAALDLDANNSAAAGIDYANSWTQSGGSVLITDTDAVLSDVDSTNLASLTVTITNHWDGTDELLSADTTGTSITASYDGATGILTLSGSDTVANYQQVLRTIRYDNTHWAPVGEARVIEFIANDGTDNSITATTTLTMATDFGVLVVTNTSDSIGGDTSSIDALIANDGGDGISLREAIIASNNSTNGTGPDVIRFDVTGAGPHVIQPTSALPAFTDTVIIDGTTEPDYVSTPIIVLDGSLAGAGANGIILAADSDGSTIRGLVINNFNDDGIDISSDNNVIQGNYIGTDVTGTSASANNQGIIIKAGASGNTIGGTTAATHNIISGNIDDGIQIIGLGTSNNTIIGNYIGTDVTGTLNIGNGGDGIIINDGATDNTIGGTAAGEGNLISGNTGDGIQIGSTSTTNPTSNITIQGNLIGTDVTGLLNLANAEAGIDLEDGVNILIGGTTTNAGNTIAFNNNDGIEVSAPVTGSAFLGNLIFSNASLGIDLNNDAVSVNDLNVNDGDTGANNLQNYPLLTSVLSDGSSAVVIGGSINTTASTVYRIEFFASAIADGSGNGEAERYLGFTTATTNGSGNTTFSASFSTLVANGEFVTATATVDLGGGNYGETSEFAQNHAAVVDLTPQLDLDSNDSSGTGGTDFDAAWTEDAGAVAITDVDAELIDVDSINLSLLTVTITNQLDGTAELLLADTTGTSITASYDSGTGVLTLSGSDTIAMYQQVLRTITYDNTSDNPNTTARSITFVANDGVNNSSVATTTVSISAVNDVPVNTVPGTQTIIEETLTAITGISITDIDAGTSIISTQLTVNNGILNVTLAGSASITIGENNSGTILLSGNITDINATLNSLKYKGNNNVAGINSDTLTILTSDLGSNGIGGSLTDSDSIQIDITNVNDAPTITKNALFTDSGQSLGSSLSTGVATGDLDGDGDIDLVESIYGGGNHIYLNDGSGNYAFSSQILNAKYSMTTTLGDIDNDGDLDIVTGLLNQPNKVFINDGLGNFTDSGQNLGGSATYSIIFGDIDNDGDLDVVAGNYSDQPDKVYINDGAGNFTDSAQSLSADKTTSIVLGDIDNDGDLDLIRGIENSPNQVHLNNGSGDFTLNTPITIGTSTQTTGVALGDIDGDGDLDLIEANNGSPNKVFINNGSGSFTDSGQTLGNASSFFIELGDIDNDGDLDLVAGNLYGQGNKVYTNNGTGIFTDSGLSLGSSHTRGISLADTNNDGDLDIIAVNGSDSANKIYINESVTTSFTTLSLTEGDPAQTITSTAIIEDTDSTDFDGGTLTISYTITGDAGDQLSVRNQGTGVGQIGFDGTNITYEGSIIGTIQPSPLNGINGNTFGVSLTSNATPIATTALLKNVTFQNTSENPTANRTLYITVQDGDGGTSTAITQVISITAVNDKPNLTNLDNTSFTALNDGTIKLINPSTNAFVNDPENASNFDNGSLQLIGTNFLVDDSLGIKTSATVTLSSGFVDGSTVSINGEIIGTLSGVSNSGVAINFNTNSTAARIDTLLQAMSFNSTSSTLGSRSVDFIFIDGDGSTNGGNETSDVVSVNIIVASSDDGLVTTLEDTTHIFSSSDFDFTGVIGADLRTVTITSLPSDGTLKLNGAAVVLNQQISKADIDSNLFTFVPDSDENGGGYASFDFYVNTGNSSVNILAGQPTSFTLGGGLLVDTDAILSSTSNFGSSGTYSASISVIAANANIDASYLNQGSVFFNGYVPDADWTAGELSALNDWVNTGGVLISTSDGINHDAVSLSYGLTLGGAADPTWGVVDGAHAIIDGSFGDVGASFSAAGEMSYFDASSLLGSDVVLATDSDSNPTMVLRQQGNGWILFISDEGIFRANTTGSGTITTANDILSANIFAWAANQVPVSETFSMNVDVTAINDTPSFTTLGNQSVGYESGAHTVANFSSAAAEGGTDEAGQTFSYNVSNNNNSLFSTNPSIDATGELSYTVAAGQTGTATVTVSVTDNGGSSDTSADQSFTITVGANTVPTISTIFNQAFYEDSNSGALAFSVADTETATGSLIVTASSSNQALISDANLTLNNLGSGNWTIVATSLAQQNGTATITVTVNDGTTSTVETFDVTVNAVNDAPILDNSGTMTLGFITENDINNNGKTVAEIITSAGGNRITDNDTSALEGIAITGSLNDSGRVSWEYSTDGGSSWSSMGSLAENQALLLQDTARIRAVPDGIDGTTSATISFRAWDQTDGGTAGTKVNTDSPNNGGTTAYSSAIESAGITVLSSNDTPIIASVEGATLEYTENDVATAITSTLTINDVDDTNIESATIKITGNYLSTEDSLAFSDTANISSALSVTPGTLTLTLTGSDTLANYITALRNVTYENSSNDPSTLTRTITFTVNDGISDSNIVTRNVSVTAVNDAPTVANAMADQSASEDSPFSFQFANNVFADVDASDTLTYTSDATDWLSFDPATRTFSGTPLNTHVGTTSVTVTATDNSGAFITDSFDIPFSFHLWSLIAMIHLPLLMLWLTNLPVKIHLSVFSLQIMCLRMSMPVIL